MKSKLMSISVLLLLALMVAPVMAKPIGPQKAVKNPNIMITPEGAELLLPSGGFNEWTADTEIWYMDFVHGLDASKAKGLADKAIPLTMEDIRDLMTCPEAALEAENEWGYMSYEVFVELFTMEFFMMFTMNFTVEQPGLINESALSYDAYAGQLNVTLVDASLFDEGDKVLIMNGLTMEYNVIVVKDGNNLTMAYDLINDYTAGSFVVKCDAAEEMAEAMAVAMAAMWPDGMYVRFVNVGK